VLEGQSQPHGVPGSVNATTVAPARRSTRGAQLVLGAGGIHGRDPSTFQLTGRSASKETVVIKSISSSLKPFRHPGTISSTVVPVSATARARASISPRSAAREGTGRPSPIVMGVDLGGGKPHGAVGQRLVKSLDHGRHLVGRGDLTHRVVAMAARRRAEWPTKKPALTPMRPSRRPSHSRTTSSSSRDPLGGRAAASPPPWPSSVRGTRCSSDRMVRGRTRNCPEHRGHPVER